MGAKRIAFDHEAREAIRQGVSRLAKTVKVTLGPRGRNVMIERGFGAPLVTKDGVTVAKELELPDAWENMGAQMVKEVASKTSDAAGDGTTTATVIAEALFERGLRALQTGVPPIPMRRGIERARAHVLAHLESIAKPVSGSEQIAHVGRIAANNDAEIGRVLAEAMDKVGKDGVITVDEGNSLDTTVEFVDGLAFDRGYLSPYFITDPDLLSCELERPLVLLVDGKVSAVKDLVPALELVLQQQRPLLLIAEDVEGEALALLVVNSLRGTLKACAVKAPGFGDSRKAQLQDIAALTGGRVVSQETGLTLEGVELQDLGGAEKAVIRKDETQLVGGEHDPVEVKTRLEQIRAEMERTTSSYDREKLEERMAKLAGGVARVLVGAATEPEMKEKKARVEDAIHATRAAVEEGIVPGGGVALLRAARSLLDIEGTCEDADEGLGIRIVREALEAPVRQIADNAGLNPAVVVERILAEAAPSYGLDASTLEYGDMTKLGIIDPAKVTRTALENAISVSSLLLTTDCLVAEQKEEVGAGMEDFDH